MGGDSIGCVADLESRKLQLAVRTGWHGFGGGAPPHLSLDALA